MTGFRPCLLCSMPANHPAHHDRRGEPMKHFTRITTIAGTVVVYRHPYDPGERRIAERRAS